MSDVEYGYERTLRRVTAADSDHHGYCQEHHGGFADGGCATKRAADFLARYPEES